MSTLAIQARPGFGGLRRLALHPRASLVATLYSAAPALIVAYGWFRLTE